MARLQKKNQDEEFSEDLNEDTNSDELAKQKEAELRFKKK